MGCSVRSVPFQGFPPSTKNSCPFFHFCPSAFIPRYSLSLSVAPRGFFPYTPLDFCARPLSLLFGPGCPSCDFPAPPPAFPFPYNLISLPIPRVYGSRLSFRGRRLLWMIRPVPRFLLSPLPGAPLSLLRLVICHRCPEVYPPRESCDCGKPFVLKRFLAVCR